MPSTKSISKQKTKTVDITTKEKNERNYALDIIRIIATFFVVSVHFFLHNGFYYTQVTGKRMFVMVCMRTLFMTCIPLFLILTGYLMNKKKLSFQYFKGIIKTISVYLLASVACIIFKWLYLKQDYTLKSALLQILQFQGANYAWYIQMYIGLFIVIPFLNLIYNGLETKKQKLFGMIGCIFFVSILPMIKYILIKMEIELGNMIPTTWNRMYPIMFYYIGAYISEYKPKMNKLGNFIAILLSNILFGGFYYIVNKENNFAWGDYQDSFALPILVLAVLIFIFLYNMKTIKLNDNIKKILKYLSELCLGAYLMSYIFDELVYARLNTVVPEMLNRIYYYPIVAVTVFAGAMLSSAVINIYFITKR